MMSVPRSTSKPSAERRRAGPGSCTATGRRLANKPSERLAQSPAGPCSGRTRADWDPTISGHRLHRAGWHPQVPAGIDQGCAVAGRDLRRRRSRRRRSAPRFEFEIMAGSEWRPLPGRASASASDFGTDAITAEDDDASPCMPLMRAVARTRAIAFRIGCNRKPELVDAIEQAVAGEGFHREGHGECRSGRVQRRRRIRGRLSHVGAGMLASSHCMGLGVDRSPAAAVRS